MAETTVSASLAIDMLQFLERHGHSMEGVCLESGLDRAILSRPDDRIPGSRMASLWRVAVARMEDEAVAVRMSNEFQPAAMDILGYVVLTCRTVGDVLACVTRYAAILNDGISIALRHEGPRIVVALNISETHRDNFVHIMARHVAESFWVGMAYQLRILATEPIVPLEVRFRHSVRDETPHREALQCPVRFGAKEDQFIIAATDLLRPLPSANPVLFTVFEQHASAVLDGLQERDSVVARVAAVVAMRLKGRVPPIGEVASELAMSARNLQRGLQTEGRTYQEVLDEVRAGLARRYLVDGQNTVSQVAFLLGFSEAAAFHRAFKRWTGMTPSELRRTGNGPGTVMTT